MSEVKEEKLRRPKGYLESSLRFKSFMLKPLVGLFIAYVFFVLYAMFLISASYYNPDSAKDLSEENRARETFNCLSLEQRQSLSLLLDGELELDENSKLEYPEPKDNTARDEFIAMTATTTVILAVIFALAFLVVINVSYATDRDPKYYFFDLRPDTPYKAVLFLCLFPLWAAFIVSYVRYRFAQSKQNA